MARLAFALGVSAGWLAYGLGPQHAEGPLLRTDGMGTRLTLIRRERGLTKAAVAQLAALSPSAYAKIENGGQSGVDTIERIAKSFGVSPAWLAFGKGPQELPPRRRTRFAPAAASP